MQKIIRQQVERQMQALVEYCTLYWELLPMPESQVYLEANEIDLFSKVWFHTACVSMMFYLAHLTDQPPEDEWRGYLGWIRGRLYDKARSERQAVLERLRAYQHQHEPFLSR